MHKFIRWYNQNRAEALIIFALIAFVIIIWQVLNSIVAKNEEEKSKAVSFKNSSTNQSATISKANESVITGEKIDTQTSNINQSIIKQFVNYCNDAKIDEAYQMLSNECKEIMYPTVDEFEMNYFSRVFETKKVISLDNWYVSNNRFTYYINYIEDALSLGRITSDSKSDYITIIYTDKGYELNINSYIGRTLYYKNNERDSVIIRLNWIDQYIDYATLNITVKNHTNKTICIDSKDDLDTLFLYDENGIKYSSYLNELSDEELTITANKEKNININFNKMYNPKRSIRGIVFSDIVLNYENFINGSEAKQRITINT